MVKYFRPLRVVSLPLSSPLFFFAPKGAIPPTLRTTALNAANIFNVMHLFMEFVNKATSLGLQIPKRKVKMTVCSIWLFAHISDDFYYLDMNEWFE